jgi:cardiolipin synthase C
MRASEKQILSLIAALGGAISTTLAVNDEAFERWSAIDAAMQRQVGATVDINGFALKLPIGWVRDSGGEDGSVELRYFGISGARLANPLRVRAFAVARADGDRAWPSAFSGWEAVRFGPHWTARTIDRAAPAEVTRFAVQVFVPEWALVLQVDVPSGGASWPGELDELLAGVTVSSELGAILGPKDHAATRNRAATLPAQPLARSPLAAAARAARGALLAGGDPAEGNQALILDSGAEALLARLHLIRHAAHSIRLQTFIWADDESGRLLLAELVAAAQRGVRVQVITDHMFSFRDTKLAAFLATVSPNLEMKHYRPAGKRIDPSPLQEAINFIIPNDTNQRMHNKVLVVDDTVFLTGGRNVQNAYFDQSDNLNFRDRDVLVIGPMADYAAAAFDDYWGYKESVSARKLKDVKDVIKSGKFKRYATRADWRLRDYFEALEAQEAEGTAVSGLLARLQPVQQALFVADPPGKESRRYSAWRRGTMARTLEGLLKQATSSVVLQTPYLVLDGATLKIFRDLRRQYPAMPLKVASNSFGSTDDPLTYAASFKFRRAYLEYAGLTVHEYMPYPADLTVMLPNYAELAQRGDKKVHRVEYPWKADRPFLCVHAKGMVVDERVAFIGSYNFDPRSIQWNTECGLLVADPAFGRLLRASMERDMDPRNSWVIAPRKVARDAAAPEIPEVLRDAKTRGLVDLWPFRFTSGFQLKHGSDPVPVRDPVFYDHFEDIGAFPGADQQSAGKIVATHLATTLTSLALPFL